jgi:two-component system sensor histidine kinase HydH
VAHPSAARKARREFALLDEGSDLTLRRRLTAWIAARIVIASVLVGSAFFAQLRHELYTPLALSYAAAAFYLASAVSALLLRYSKPIAHQRYVQPVFDIVATTLLVYLFGGTTSGFTVLYAVSALATAFVLGPSATRAFGFASIIAYVFVAQELSVVVMRNGVGIVLVAWLGTILSSRLRRIGGELRTVQKKVEDAERLAALGRLAAALAHEIRNPLGAISGSVQLVAEAESLSDEDRRLLGIVVRETARLEQLVETMLAVGKPLPPERQPTDVGLLATEVADIARKDPSFTSPILVEIDSQRGELVASLDEAQIRQVLWNLLKNAMQASPADRAVVLRVRRDKQDLILEVIDRGGGIPPELRERLFEVFFTGRPQGTGLGLVLVEQIAVAHDGYVEVESQVGEGSTFRVVVPIQSERASTTAS